tara:strand:- start:1007 stop:1612 length:606 start_codon:yes stop_codon:yes gene_type:complete
MSVKTIQERYEEELERFKYGIIEMVKETFHDNGGINPIMYALVIKDDKLIVSVLQNLHTLFNTDSEKQKAVEIIKEFNAEMKPIAIAFVSEGWAKILSDSEMNNIFDESGNYIDPSMRPGLSEDKIEVIMIHFETYDQCAINYIKVNRDVYPVELEDFESQDWTAKEDAMIDGMFTDLLQENYSEMNQWLEKELKQKHNWN